MYLKMLPWLLLAVTVTDEFSAKNGTQRDMHEGVGSPGKDKES